MKVPTPSAWQPI